MHISSPVLSLPIMYLCFSDSKQFKLYLFKAEFMIPATSPPPPGPPLCSLYQRHHQHPSRNIGVFLNTCLSLSCFLYPWNLYKLSQIVSTLPFKYILILATCPPGLQAKTKGPNHYCDFSELLQQPLSWSTYIPSHFLLMHLPNWSQNNLWKLQIRLCHLCTSIKPFRATHYFLYKDQNPQNMTPYLRWGWLWCSPHLICSP